MSATLPPPTMGKHTIAGHDSLHEPALMQSIGYATQFAGEAFERLFRTNKIPFLQSLASWPLMVMSGAIMCGGLAIPLTPLGTYLGFTVLPLLYYPLLALTLLCYVILTQLVKMWLLRRMWI